MAKGRAGGPASTARRAAAFLLAAEERPVPSPAGRAADAAIAAVAAIVAVVAAFVQARGSGGVVGSFIDRAGHPSVLPGLGGTGWPSAWMLLSAVLTTTPLAFRRIYPIGTFCVILVAVLSASGQKTTLMFAAVIFAAYSAVAYSPFRRLALSIVLAAALMVTAAYGNTTPPVPGRFTALLILLPTVAVGVAIRVWRRRAGESAERLRVAEQEHEAHTRRAVALERARIASEMHDVVTHNVSVMVVQAGAARRVLDTSPGDAREALLAVEASGRTAMTELRNLLGLLAPSGEAGVDGEGAELTPQPGMTRIPALLERVRAAGLPVELSVDAPDRTPRVLPPGVDLAAYRVIQEGLTNVMKHAGQARTFVCIEYHPRELLITVRDDGRTAEAEPAASAHGQLSGPGGGRGLIGLRERIALYGGELGAGPRPGGGWRLAARIPLDPVAAGDGRPGPDLPVPPEYQAASS